MLFVEHRVWRRRDDGRVVLYRCLQQLGRQLYAVQNADFFSPAAGPQDSAASDARFIELLREESPLVRCTWHASLDLAIEAHDDDFA